MQRGSPVRVGPVGATSSQWSLTTRGFEFSGASSAWNGEPEAISRLVLGYSPALPAVLEKQLGVPPTQLPQAMQIISQRLQTQIVSDSMPIQDAIDLAYFLVDVTEKYSRYTPGAATVGGPIEVAAITKHEGFKWVERKYYYNRDLNPEASP